jgi:hypothetical protein
MLPVSALSLSIDIKKNVFRFFTRWEKTCWSENLFIATKTASSKRRPSTSSTRC